LLLNRHAVMLDGWCYARKRSYTFSVWNFSHSWRVELC